MFESLLAFLHALQGWPAYALVFAILVGSGFGLPMNEDLLLVAAAALTLSGVMEPLALVAVAWCGIVIADGLIFHWGRVFGTRLLERGFAGGRTASLTYEAAGLVYVAANPLPAAARAPARPAARLRAGRA